MDLKKPIVLIGLMGTGKTTIGQQLAAKLGVPFLDSDREIEEQAGSTIAEIFARDGEEFFRKVEAKTIAGILESGRLCVLATGGGAFMNEETQAVIAETAVSIWLRARLETLIERLEHNNTRPLLEGVDKAVRLKKLMEERHPVYQKADIVVDTDGNSRTVVTSKILRSLEGKK